jgi:hypothetical protein
MIGLLMNIQQIKEVDFPSPQQRFHCCGDGKSTSFIYCNTQQDAHHKEYTAAGGMRIGKVNRSTQRKPTPMPLSPPQIPHKLIWDRTSATEVQSRRLIA